MTDGWSGAKPSIGRVLRLHSDPFHFSLSLSFSFVVFFSFFGRPRTVQLAGNGRRTLTPSVELRRNSVRIEIRRLCGWTCGNILATGSLSYKVVGDFLNFFKKFEI